MASKTERADFSMTTQVTATCRYCRATLPRHVSMATHYATCAVLANCLGPASPFPGRSVTPAPPQVRVSEVETPAPITGAGEASRADEQHEIVLARARRKAEKHK